MGDEVETPQAEALRRMFREAIREELEVTFRNVLHVNIRDGRSLHHLNQTLDWAERTRKASESTWARARLVLVGLAVVGVAGLVVQFFRGSG